VKGNPYLHPLAGESGQRYRGGHRMNPGIGILPLSSAKGLLGGRMCELRSEQLLVLRMGNYLRRHIKKLTNNTKKWKGNGKTATLLFSIKGLEILHKERRGQVKTIVMEHFNDILFHKSGPVNKHHTNQSINYLVEHRTGQKVNLWWWWWWWLI